MDANQPIWKRLALALGALLAAGLLAGCMDNAEEAQDDGPIDDGDTLLEDGTQGDGAQEPPAADDDGVVEDSAAGDEERNVENAVIISGAVYECDTFLETTNTAEGQCDEYQLNANEDAAAFPNAVEAEVVDAETVTINGMTYTCDDDGLEDLWDGDEAEENEVAADEVQAETCEEYVLQGSNE